MSTPEIVTHPDRPYAAVAGRVTMSTFPEIADRFGEVFGHLAARGAEPAGAPFFRYRGVAMPGPLDIEAGIPVAEAVEGEGEVFAGVLPAGRYVTVSHVGHPDQLVDVTASLLAWAAGQDLEFDKEDGAENERWGSRLEFYLTDPRDEPDLNKWEVLLEFRLAR
ncbi:GyrI-like domain-containing protein [Phytomonospora sp. NPDC050363]|uniref:GyrI-like domain-containing protein n=1 Tax=Phytomonospora sp. NPDC050363 TaxID=3155642 RepID=UPI0033EFAA0B